MELEAWLSVFELDPAVSVLLEWVELDRGSSSAVSLLDDVLDLAALEEGGVMGEEGVASGDDLLLDFRLCRLRGECWGEPRGEG